MENTTVISETKCLNSCLDLHEPECITREICKRFIENVYIFPSSVEWIYIGLYIILFCCGIVGNTLVCYVIYTCHHMQTFVNIFIFNLAVADFLVIFVCLPPTMMADVTETWYLGETMCKIVPFLQVTFYLQKRVGCKTLHAWPSFFLFKQVWILDEVKVRFNSLVKNLNPYYMLYKQGKLISFV